MAQSVEFDAEKQPRWKVELHIHLEGAVRLSTVWDIAQEKEIDLGVKSMKELYDVCHIKHATTLADFLKPFSIFWPVIAGDSEAIERVAYEFCEDAVNQKVFYCEVRYCPHLLSTTYGEMKVAPKKPLTPRDVVMCVNKGLSRGSADFKLTVRSILCCLREHSEWSNEILDLCMEFQRQGVVGIDIAGDEAQGLAEHSDIDVFKRAARLGIHRTVHAGEAGPASNVQRALSEMFAERIGHGYHVVDDPDIYTNAKNRNVHFEACPHSSILTGSVPKDAPKHPIVRFAEDEVNFSLSRDDPTITQKTLNEEYEFVRGLGLKEVHIIRANFNAARSCFLPANEKNQLLQQLEQVYGTQLNNAIPNPMFLPPKAFSGSGDF